MDLPFEPLEELENATKEPQLKFPRFWKLLSIPRLVDKPQNPILATIERLREPYLTALPEELVSIVHTTIDGSRNIEDVSNIWDQLSLDSELGSRKVRSFHFLRNWGAC